MVEYPYLASNKNLPIVLDKIKTAAKPVKFTQAFLSNLGFTSSNDRAMIPLFRKLGFLTEDGSPTVYYDHIRDPNTAKTVLGDRIKALYSDIFAINTSIHKATDIEVKGAISRVTGKDEDNVSRVYSTFKCLVACADFDKKNIPLVDQNDEPQPEVAGKTPNTEMGGLKYEPSFHYNIQIHLPATTEIGVYNAIFKSIKENLLS